MSSITSLYMKFKSDLNFVKICQNVISFDVCSLMVLSVLKVIAPVTGEWMSILHWGNDTDRGKSKY